MDATLDQKTKQLKQMKGVLEKVNSKMPRLTRSAFVSAFDIAIAIAHEDYTTHRNSLIEKYGKEKVHRGDLPVIPRAGLNRAAETMSNHVFLLEVYKERVLKLYDEERTEDAGNDTI